MAFPQRPNIARAPVELSVAAAAVDMVEDAGYTSVEAESFARTLIRQSMPAVL
jgi:hypothetical protein